MPSEMSSIDQAVVCRRFCGSNRARAVEVVKSFEFEARIRGRPALREKRTWLLLASSTNAPLLPTPRKSFRRAVESFEPEIELCAEAAPWAIGVLKPRSGPPGRAWAVAGSAAIATPNSVTVTAPLSFAVPIGFV